jgi:hypothetical protein
MSYIDVSTALPFPLVFGEENRGCGKVLVGDEGARSILEELGVDRGEKLLKSFELDDAGEPMTNGLRISMLPAGESADGSNTFLRWPRSGFGG